MNDSLETIKYISYQLPFPHTYPAEGDCAGVSDVVGVEGRGGGLPLPRVDDGSLLVLDVHHEVELAFAHALQLENEGNPTDD